MQVLLAHADTGVDDLDEQGAVAVLRRLHPHAGVGRGERGGVLEQLGDEVHDVARRPAQQLGRGRRREVDALVLLHLGGGGAQHVDQRHRAAAPPREVGAREHQQVLRVAAHARREVVELEEVGERLRVLLGVLQLLDEAQLALDQRLGAARQVHEDRVERRAQTRLLGGEADRLLVHLVERAGDLADLLARRDRRRDDRGVRRLALAQAADGLGQAPLGDVERAAAQQAQRTQQRAGDEEDHRGAGHQREQQDHRGDARAVAGRLLQGARLLLELAAQLLGGRGVPVLDGRGRALPVRPRDLQREPRGTAAEDHLGQQVAVVDVRAHDGVGQPGVVGADRRAEVVDGDRAAQRGVARLVDRRGVDAARGDAGGDDGLDVGVLLAHHRQRVEAGGEPGDARVGGLPGERPVEDLEGVDDLGVAGDRARGVHPAVDDVVAQAVELVELGVGLVERRASSAGRASRPARSSAAARETASRVAPIRSSTGPEPPARPAAT